MSKIILVVLLAVVFCLFATVPASAIAHRRQSRTLTPQAADQVFNSEEEGEHGYPARKSRTSTMTRMQQSQTVQMLSWKTKKKTTTRTT